MRKRFCVFSVVLCMCFGVLWPDMTVWAASGKTSLSVSASSVNIGDTVTVSAKASGPSGEQVVATMTLSWDSSVLQFVSCSTTYGGGGNSVTAATDSFTVTLKAVSAGNSGLSLSGNDGFSYDDSVGELESMAGSSASVTVNNAAGTGNAASGTATSGTAAGNTATGNATSAETKTAAAGTTTEGNDATTEKKSADNSLKTLTISPGTLSPQFSGSNTKYTATVSGDVDSLAVSAVPVNEKAVVESVTGNEGLKEGDNTVKVVVRAENGVTATYTIQVTKQGKSQQTEPESEQTEESSENVQETGQGLSINDVAYEISENFTQEDIPANFAENTITYHGNAYKGVSYDKGGLNMLWLVTSDAEGRFFIYDEARDALYPFVRIGSDEMYVIALMPPVDYAIPENYMQTSIPVNGTDSITAYQEAVSEETDAVPEFYVFYAQNQAGAVGWYQYDVMEGTYQRLKEIIAAEEKVAGSDMESLQEEYDALSQKYSEEKSFSRNVIGILIFVLAVLVIVIINLLLHRFRKKDEYDDYDDYDDDYDDAGDGAEQYVGATGSDTEDLAKERVLEEGSSEEDLYEEERDEVAAHKRERKLFFRRDRDALEEEDLIEGEEVVEEQMQKAAPVVKESKRNRKTTENDIEIIDFNDL